MDFYLTTSASTFPCFQINWYECSFFITLGLLHDNFIISSVIETSSVVLSSG